MPDLPDYELLSAYLDGELSEAEKLQAEQMLAASAEARQFIEESAPLSSTLKALPANKIGGDFGEKVLRVANRRRLTQSASAEVQAEPLSKTVLRRLKNPRIWAWQVVIIAVAMLLMLYNPNRNQPPEVHGSREVALRDNLEKAPSPPEKAMDSPSASFRLADEKDKSKVAEVESSPAKPSAEPTRGAGTIVAHKSVEKEAQPIPDQSGLSKTASSGESVEQPILGKAGAVPASKAETASNQPDLGKYADEKGGQDGKWQFEMNEAPSGGQMATGKNGANQQINENANIQEQPFGDMLVVNCDINPEAIKNQAFDKVLSANGIQWSKAWDEFLESAYSSNRDIEQSKMADQAKKDTNQAGQLFGKAEPLEIIYVEAQPALIQSTISSLSTQHEAFSNVSVTTANELSQSVNSKLGESNRTALNGVRNNQIPRQAQEQVNRAIQSANTANDRAQSLGGNASANTANTTIVRGRAQRVTDSDRIGFGEPNQLNSVAQQSERLNNRLSYNAQILKQSVPAAASGGADMTQQTSSAFAGGAQALAAAAPMEQEKLKQERSRELTSNLQSAIPSNAARQDSQTSARLGMPNADQPGSLNSTQQTNSNTSQQLQRAVFVLRVVNPNQSPDNTKAANPADDRMGK